MPFAVRNVEALSGILALFRVKTVKNRWLACLLPGIKGQSWGSLADSLKNAREMVLGAEFEKFGFSTKFHFDRDPVMRMLESMGITVSAPC